MKGNIPQWAFQSVCAAFSSLVNINHLNAQCAENRRGKLSQRLNAVFGIESIPNHPNYMLLDWVLAATTIDLKAMRVESVEQRRILWTTFQNLDQQLDRGIGSYGMNEKGGMDQEEFKKYVMNSIVPLFPDSDDVPGKRVMI
jgi:hypothetical protein